MGHYQASTLKILEKIINGEKSLIIFAKSSIRDVWQRPKYASVNWKDLYFLYQKLRTWFGMWYNQHLEQVG